MTGSSRREAQKEKTLRSAPEESFFMQFGTSSRKLSAVQMWVCSRPRMGDNSVNSLRIELITHSLTVIHHGHHRL
jgi:hypothetical protein